MGLGRTLARAIAPASRRIAPEYAQGFVRQVLDRAIDGVGRLPGAAAAADRRLAKAGDDVDQAIHDLIETHVRLAGVQGFVTNLGGLMTFALTVPANVTGVALLQCHLVASIAHLRGYDLADPRVRNAILICLLGEDKVKDLIRQRRLPSSPMAIATAPAHDPDLDRRISTEVTTELVTRVGGKRVVTMVGRRVPVVGGGIGALTDGYATWQVGRYADRALLPRST
ncbi:MAG: EcsC family protein [Actinomycetota bacterium]|nr:EcsC family protein [Actinomycetota bacterium]